MYQTTRAGMQEVFACNCGMVFCSCAVAADYEHSLYEAPGAIGSGTSEHDHGRLMEVAATVKKFAQVDEAVLDVGCAQGGLLDALRSYGFARITGLDPSQACVDATRAKGHHAIRGVLDGRVLGTYDLITLSHVLEHIDDVKGFLRQVMDHLAPNGRVYIEVPDLTRHPDFGLPFLELNSEHINHFTLGTLMETMNRCGFAAIDFGLKKISLTSGSPYPAIWVVYQRKPSARAMRRYIADSQAAMDKASLHIEKELGDAEECIIWGAGEYLCHVAALPVFKHVKVVQVVDRNPALWGKPACFLRVEQPSHIRRTCPIVIAALVAAPAIKADIEKMGLANKVITLESK
jgi:SAM-dependent methyltransferase